VNQSAGIRHIFTGSRLLSLSILGLAEFVRGALLFFILPIYIHGDLGFSAAVVGYALGAHYTADTVLRSPSGWLTDRFGQRRVILLAQVFGWLGLWLIIDAKVSLTVITGCALLGVGMAAVWPAVISRVTGGLSSETYATAMGGVMMAWLSGAGAGAVSMSWILGNHVHSGFVVLLIVWLASMVMSIFSMQGYKANIHSNKHRLHLSHVLREVKGVRLLLPGMFVQTFAMGLLLPVFVLYTTTVLGLDGKTYSYLLIAGGAATVLLQIPMGRLVDRYGYKFFLLLGFAICATMIPVLIHLKTLWIIFIGVAGLGTGYAFILPAWNSVLAQSVSEKRRAVMWGIFMTVEGVGMALGPLVGGKLWTNFNPTTPFWAASIILVSMMIFYGIAPLEHLFHTRGAEDLAEGR
jgi:DHA1 family multidrug resistance protein-like MFS transporter